MPPIPLQIVDEAFFEAVEVAIAAAEASSSSCKKAKISSSGNAPPSGGHTLKLSTLGKAPPGHLPKPCRFSSDGTECSIGHHRIAFKDEASSSSRSLEKAFAAHAAGKHENVYGSVCKIEAPASMEAPIGAGYPAHMNAQTPTHGHELQPVSNLEDIIPAEAWVSDEKKLSWILAPCYFKVKEGNVPYFQFNGQIKYSNTPMDAEHAAYELLRQVEAKKARYGGPVPLGFDAEWKVIEDQAQKVAVLQLCMDADSCNVFHIIHSGIPSPLRTILEDPSVLKVGVGVYGDAKKVLRGYNVAIKGVRDLNELANLKLRGPGQVNRLWSLSSLAEELLGKQVEKSKGIRMGDWEDPNLSKQQLEYAAVDAFASLSVFQAQVASHR